MNTTLCVEIVLFNTKAGVSDDDVLKSVKVMEPIIEQLDGLISYKVLKDKEGRWMDLAYWQSREHAERAAEKVMQIPAFVEAMAVIDESTLQMMHFDQVRAYEYTT